MSIFTYVVTTATTQTVVVPAETIRAAEAKEIIARDADKIILKGVEEPHTASIALAANSRRSARKSATESIVGYMRRFQDFVQSGPGASESVAWRQMRNKRWLPD